MRFCDYKTRKQLPAFGKLPHLHFDIARLQQHCKDEKLFDYNRYNDIKVSSNSAQVPFVKANSFNKRSFFQEKNAQDLEGDSYKQLYLTRAPETILRQRVRTESSGSPGRRLARLDPNNPAYDPIADEMNYTERSELVRGMFAEILDAFAPDQPKRVRLAYLAPLFGIAPHVDYDPSYIVRYHIPIMTNPLCTMNVILHKTQEIRHFPADGSVYFFNAGLKHWAENNSEQGRLHLIVDVHGQYHLDKVCAL